MAFAGSGGHRGIYQVAEFLAGLEVGDAFCGNVDFCAGLWITAGPGLPLADAEAAKTANFDLVARLERLDDRFKDGFYDYFAVATGQIAKLSDFFHQVCFGHLK